jgi:Ca2+-binding EF-hand superfamily protein
MGAGASIDAASMLSKEEAMALAGDQWDEAKWEAAEKDESGKIKAELILALATPAEAAAAPAEEAAAPPVEAAASPVEAAAPPVEAAAPPVEAAAPPAEEAAPAEAPGPDGSAMPAEAAVPAAEEPAAEAAAPEKRASTVDEMQHHAKAIATSGKYVFGDPKSAAPHGDTEGLSHLSAGGFATGTAVTQMETPKELHGAEIILFKLAQKLEADGDAKSSGFGTRYRPVTVNYYKMFKSVDLDCDKLIEIDEFEKVIRRVLGIPRSSVSETEIKTLFKSIDLDGTGAVSVAEFALFAKGAQPAAAYRGELTYHEHDVASSAGSTQLGGSLDQDNSTLDDNKAEAQALESVPHLSDRASISNSAAAARVDKETDANQTSGMVFHPGHISYPRLFKKLDLDVDGKMTRDEFAIALRRHIGVGVEITDDDLNSIFDAMDESGDNMVSLREFCAFARGASTATMARGVAHSVKPKE